jgi:hypothetical protein
MQGQDHYEEQGPIKAGGGSELRSRRSRRNRSRSRISKK